jgi:hypothetical protein
MLFEVSEGFVSLDASGFRLRMLFSGNMISECDGNFVT